MDITTTEYIGTSEMEATVAIAALDAELDGDYSLAEQIRHDYAEAVALATL
jgi:hypothetical protein